MKSSSMICHRAAWNLLIACVFLLSACAKLNPFQQPPDNPVIDSISPSTGRIGTQVRLYGTGFSNYFSGDTVRFNGVLVQVDSFSNSTVILVTVDSNTGTGPVTVTVNGKQATGPIFTYDQNAISLNSLSPPAGWVDTLVTLRGVGFGTSADSVTVNFNGHPANIQRLSDTLILVQAPNATNGAPGQVTVTVSRSGRTSNGLPFLYSQKPVISGVVNQPWKSVNYYWIAVAGLAPVTAGNQLTVNGHAVHIDSILRSGTQEYNQLPIGEKLAVRSDSVDRYLTGAQAIFVVTANGLVSDPFTFVNNPLIINISAPARQPFQFAAGDTVTITGNYFDVSGPGSQVQIDSNNSAFSPSPTILSWTDKQIVVVIPTYNDPDSTPLQLSVLQGTHIGNANVLYRVPGGGSGVFSVSALSVARDRLAAAGIGTKILFAGGFNNDYNGVGNSQTYFDAVDIYDVNASTWTTAQLSGARADLVGAATGNTIVFGGGQNAAGVSAIADIYNATAGTWTAAQLSLARWGLAAAGTGSKILFGGGVDMYGNISGAVDLYDVNAGTWTTAQLSVARWGLAAAAAGSKILFAGGTTGTFYSSAVDIYDVNTGTWTTAQLSEARINLSAAAAGNKILFAGGRNTSGVESTTVDIYDVTTGAWTTSQLSVGRESMSAAGAGNKVVFAGGISTSAYDYQTVDIYDVVAGTWTAALLSEARELSAGAAAGNVVIIGGGFTSGVTTNGPVYYNTADIIHF